MRRSFVLVALVALACCAVSVSAKLPPEAMFADEALLSDAAAVTQGKIVGDSKNFNAS